MKKWVVINDRSYRVNNMGYREWKAPPVRYSEAPLKMSPRSLRHLSANNDLFWMRASILSGFVSRGYFLCGY